MNNNLFWNNWNKNYRLFYWLLLSLSTFVLSTYVFFYFYGGSLSIGWETATFAEKLSIPVDEFSSGIFNFTVEADNFLVLQTIKGSVLKIHPWITYLFIFIWWICIMIMLTATTNLSRFWYYAGVVLFVFILVNFQFGHLKIFGKLDNTFLIISLIVYLPTTYLLQAVFYNLSFILKFLILLIISLILALVIHFYSQVAHPFYYLAVYGLATPVILSIIFILIVSYQILLAFLYILTRASTGVGKNNTIHFLVISLFYLIYFILTFLHQVGIIDWNLVYFDPFIILIFSAVIGIWGFRQRASMFQNTLPFYPSGGYVYLSGFIICFITISFFTATANDPILETFEDAITFSHIGFGFSFLLYIMANFFSPMMQNLGVYKVVYNPKHMPYFTASLVGIIITAGLFFYTNKISYRQAIAGFYNGIGDLYRLENENFTAEQYYKLGLDYGFGNHRSSYSLATLAQQLNAPDLAMLYYNESLKKQPSPQSFINIADLYQQNGKFFDALFTLKKGLQAFPQSGAIGNNLGLLYAKTNILDSAFIFLESATRNNQTEDEATTNLYYLLAKNKIALNLDSIATLAKSVKEESLKSNMLSYLNQFGYTVELGEPNTKTALDWNSFMLVNNYVHNNLNKVDSNFLYQYSRDTSNLLFLEALDKAKAYAAYYSGNKTKAFFLGDQLQVNSPANAAEYNNLLGLWAIDQESPQLAYDFFEKAENLGHVKAGTNKLIALTESGQIGKALEGWTAQTIRVDSTNYQLARKMMHMLEGDSAYFNGDEKSEYYYQRLRIKLIQNSLNQVPFFYKQLEGTPFEALAIHDIVSFYIRKENLSEAVVWFEKANGLEITNAETRQKLNRLRILLMSKLESYAALASTLTDESVRQDLSTYETLFYEGLLDQQAGRKNEALTKFRIAASADPFFEEAVVYASNYIHQNSTDDMEAYRLLYNAIQINKYSIAVKKAYILQSLLVRLPQYAEDVLNEISQDMTMDEYLEFRTKYDSIQESISKKLENW